MEARTLHRIGLTIGSAMLIALSACAGDSRTTESPPAARTTPTEPRLLAEEYAEGEAIVQAVNKTDRTVTLRNAQGQSTTVPVPADVDLNRLRNGDTVLIGVYHALSVRVLPPGAAALGATAAVGSTAPGQPEGGAWGQELTLINEVTAIDLAAHTATLRGADGRLRTIAVKDPEIDRMRNLRVGDLVELTYSEAVAAKVLPKSWARPEREGISQGDGGTNSQSPLRPRDGLSISTLRGLARKGDGEGASRLSSIGARRDV